jgi:Asp/Glu/hydantoin racemase
VKKRVPVPVLRPNEAAFEEALELGDSLGILVTFGPSRESLAAELNAMAAERGRRIFVQTILAEGALPALKAGDAAAHDRIAAAACRNLEGIDALILGQFSLARAADGIRGVTSVPVLTTPACAVRALRTRLDQRGGASRS